MSDTPSLNSASLGVTRQAPIGILMLAIQLLGSGRSYSIGFFALIVATRRSASDFALLFVALCIGAVIGALRWWRFTFEIKDGELLVRKGLVFRERLVIPLEKVQSLSIEQQLLHRIFNVVKVGVDTAGSTEVEFAIDAVPRTQAELMQEVVASFRAPVSNTARSDSAIDGSLSLDQVIEQPAEVAAVPPREEPFLRRSVGELIKVGLSRLPWAGLAVLLPFWFVNDQVFGDATDSVFDAVEGSESAAGVSDSLDSLPSTAALVVAGIAVFFALTILGWVLQVARELLTNWKFELNLSHDGQRLAPLSRVNYIDTETTLVRRSGLLTKTTKSSKVVRIQSLRYSVTLLQRLFSFGDSNLAVIGEGDIVIPGSSENELRRVRELIFGSGEPGRLNKKFSKYSILFETRTALIVALFLLVGGLVLSFGPLSFLALALVPLLFVLSFRRWRLSRWSLEAPPKTDNPAGIEDSQNIYRVCKSEELFTRTVSEVALFKTQSVTLKQSLFQRRRNLATLVIGLASGEFQLHYLPLQDAERIRDLALYSAEASNRRWM